MRRVLPNQAFRHMVVNYPLELSQKLAFQPALVSAMECLVGRETRRWMEQRCGGASTGGVQFRHRFGTNLRLQPHGHILVLDGGYRWNDDGGKKTLEFVRAPDVSNEELRAFAEALHGRMARLLKRHSISLSTESTSVPQEPMTGIAVRHKGLHVFASRPLSCRAELKRVCRYLLRSGVDASRIRELASGDFAYRLDRKSADGLREEILSGPEWMKKLASLVPAARKPLRRYFGILAGGSKMRKHIVPAFFPVVPRGPAKAHIPWAELMKLTFGKDVLACTRCGAQMEVVAIHAPPGRARASRARQREAPD